jgi:hypothetical protein
MGYAAQAGLGAAAAFDGAIDAVLWVSDGLSMAVYTDGYWQKSKGCFQKWPVCKYTVETI